MNVKLPPVISQMQVFASAVQRALSAAVASNEATPRILLQSPGTATTAPTIYALTISNAGVMTTTLVDGKDRV